MESRSVIIHRLAQLQATRPREIDDIKYTLDWIVKSLDELLSVAIRHEAQH